MKPLSVLLLLALVACAKEKKTENQGGVVAKEGGLTDETKVPNDKNSRQFMDHLIRNPLQPFSPGDTGSIKLTWLSTRFGPKNRFQAEAVVDGAGEKFTCEEKGSWEMTESAETTEKGTVTVHIDSSNCPGRPSSGSMRLVITEKSGDYDITIHQLATN